MKRYGNLFDKVISLENIALAHKKAKKDKLFYKEVRMVDKNPNYYFKKIQKMLADGTYIIRPSDYTMFKKMDKGKEREIYKLDYFPHRIIQHALMNVVQDIFHKSFIDNTFSSIPKRGIHLALKRMDNDIKSNPECVKYCLKLDIKKFYPSVSQIILKQQIRSKFKDYRIIWLFDVIISSMDSGIAIGSLVSQWLGNFNLTKFDHWLKEDLKIKFYYRYCDDLVILHHDKKFLHILRAKIDTYLSENLKLEVKENWQVFPSFTRGIDFVGYRHFKNYILLRKSTAKSLKRKLSRILKRCESGKSLTYGEWCSINSYRGWSIYCNGHNLTERYIVPLLPYAEMYYNLVIKGGAKLETILEREKYSRKSSELRSEC